MNIFRTIKSVIFHCVAIAALSATTASASNVVDEGKFFTADAIRSADEKLQELHHLHDYSIKVETIAQLPASELDNVRQMSASERAKFFGHFLSKRAASEKLDLLIFASRDPKYLQVLPHKKLESAGFTTAMRDKLASELIAGFHGQKYDEALSSAVTRLQQDFLSIHRPVQAPAGVHAGQLPLPREHVVPRQPTETSWFGPIVLAALVVGAFLLFRRLLGGARGGAGAGNNMSGTNMPGNSPGGGGFMGNILGGVFGAMAGNWLYDSFMRPSAHGQDYTHSEGGSFGSGTDANADAGDYTSDSYDSSGGGGDFGGGDMGGGDGGGGDY